MFVTWSLIDGTEHSHSQCCSIMSRSSSALSLVDECCLKTALAFCVLRQRKKLKAHDTKLPFCRNLLSPKLSSTGSTATAVRSHLDTMLKVGVATAQSLYNVHETIYDMLPSTHNSSSVDRLHGVASHLATQLLSFPHGNHDWIPPWIEDSLVQHNALAVCSVWHYVTSAEPLFSDVLIAAIGTAMVKIYLDEVVPFGDADVLVVNLLYLLEATIVLKLNSCSITTAHEVLELVSLAIGSELSLPVPMHAMASFFTKNNGTNLSAPSKLLLRLGLYDLMVKLSHL